MRFLMLAVLLAACSSDEPTLYEYVAPTVPVAAPWEPPPPPPVPPVPSPWEAITPGQFPDVYFAVVWSDYPCDDLLDGDGADPLVGDIWGPCPSSLAIVDLMGQVIAEFDWPAESDEDSDQPWWNSYNHLALQPAGPGRVLVVAENWGDELDSDADGFWQGVRWHGWIADAVDGSLSEVLRWTPEAGYIDIVESGRRIPMEPWGTWIHVGVWPEDPDWLMLWGGEGNCANGGEGLQSLMMTHRSQPMDLGRMWTVDELLPPDLAERETTLWPWAMQAGMDEAGRGQLLLGVADDSCLESAGEPELVSWSPDEGVAWRAQTGVDTQPMEATFAAWSGGGALTLATPAEPGGAPRWRVSQPLEQTEGELPLDRWQHRAGPLLDPAGPTFATMGAKTAEAGDAIDIFHGGQKVWSIEKLKFGLQERDVYLRDVILLPSL